MAGVWLEPGSERPLIRLPAPSSRKRGKGQAASERSSPARRERDEGATALSMRR